MAGKPEFLWPPPDGQQIVAMCTFRDVVVVACTNGVYIIAEKVDRLDDFVIRQIQTGPFDWSR